ncbi:MAG: MBL fold metallo-hydrolase [Ignavibacteriae bacterium]|nr:MBL fold metallo-hydrolase [Ignavibacteriota bacterium]
MKIKTFTVNPFQMNSYLYYCENTKEGVIIDPGYDTKYEQDDLLEHINGNNIRINYILMTHGHIDHILGNGFAVDNFAVPSYLHKDDLFLYERGVEQAVLYGVQIPPLPEIKDFIDERLKIKVGNNELNFIHTPGHSPGGVCIVDHSERVVFCGDVVFQSSIGRTDLPGGDYETLISSINVNLFSKCSDEYKLYPGHMDSTTVGEEKKSNPYLR